RLCDARNFKHHAFARQGLFQRGALPDHLSRIRRALRNLLQGQEGEIPGAKRNHAAHDLSRNPEPAARSVSEGNSYIERFHRRLKEEELGLAEYRNLQEAQDNIARYLWKYNHGRPRRGLRNPHASGGALQFSKVT